MGKKAITAAFALTLLLFSFASVQISETKAQFRTILVPTHYPTIEAAISNAADGDTIFIKSGTYEGPINQTIVINKSISIVGENASNTILNLHPKYNETWILTSPFYEYTDAIQINANDFTLANLTVRFIGNMRANGDRLKIFGNEIWSHSTATGMYLNGNLCSIVNNTFLGIINLNGSYNFVSENDANGLRLESVHHSFVNSNILNVMSLTNSTANTITKNEIDTGNVWYVTWLMNSSSNIFYNNHIKSYGWNTNLMITYQSINNTFYGNAFLSNNDPNYVNMYVKQNLTVLDSTSYNNSWSKSSVGNYWNNYQMRYPNASEVGNSGIGDIPYVIDENNTDYYPLMNFTANLPALPNLLSTPALSPTPMPTPTVSPTPSPSPSTPQPSSSSISTTTPTPLPTEQPTTEPSPTATIPNVDPPSHASYIFYALIILAIVALTGVAVYFRKIKK